MTKPIQKDAVKEVYMKNAYTIMRNLPKLKVGESIGFGPIYIKLTNTFPYTIEVCIYDADGATDDKYSNRKNQQPIVRESYMDMWNCIDDFWDSHSNTITKEFLKWLDKFNRNYN